MLSGMGCGGISAFTKRAIYTLAEILQHSLEENKHHGIKQTAFIRTKQTNNKEIFEQKIINTYISKKLSR